MPKRRSVRNAGRRFHVHRAGNTRVLLLQMWAMAPVPGARKRRILFESIHDVPAKGEFMRMTRRSFPGWLGVGVVAAFAAGVAMIGGGASAVAQKTTLETLVSSVVRIKAHINPDGRTVEN